MKERYNLNVSHVFEMDILGSPTVLVTHDIKGSFLRRLINSRCKLLRL